MTKNQIGILGLGTMGKSLALNFCDHEIYVAGYNRTYEITKRLALENTEYFTGYQDLSDFVDSLQKPRKIILMVKSGQPIDEFCDRLCALLDVGDILVDGGNSYFKDTMVRQSQLEKKGIHYFGVGISGGEKGARNGPSIMPGGSREHYEELKPFLERIAAKKNGEPCCVYVGENGAGHYVKMVHNGIEYADMQLIVEAYLMLKQVGCLSNDAMATIFESWNKTELRSYLMGITVKILREKDPKTHENILDLIKDESKQKGTGKWTSIESLHQGQNTSLISGAVLSRMTSTLACERKQMQTEMKKSEIKMDMDKDAFVNQVKNAYHVGKIIAYAQGFSLLADASIEYNWNLDLGGLASIFRAGCIIQADFLDVIMDCYKVNSHLKNIILSPTILTIINTKIDSLRDIVIKSVQFGIPCPLLSASTTYLDQLRSPLLGAALIQAQRDFFGAHTFERIDREGSEHYVWEQ